MLLSPIQGRQTIRWPMLLLGLLALAVQAQNAEPVPGVNVESLLLLAKANNRELASLRNDAAAAQERVGQADVLPDPRIKLELLDVTKMGAQNPTLWPGEVGSTRYTLTQEIPWFGTRALKHEQAEFAAQGAYAQAQSAWADVAERIKLGYAQLYFLQRSHGLDQEVLDLMQRLEQIARTRYANGLAPQQDVIRAQSEQTAMQGELIALQTELHHGRARMNALLARPIHAELAEPQCTLPTGAMLHFEHTKTLTLMSNATSERRRQ